MVKAQEYMHPEDSKALREMESIPGFPTLVKKFLSVGFETLRYGINMASSIRLSPTQLPELYNHLPPICEKLGIEEPEFYLQMSPFPNAWTFGDTRVFITITSALVEMMNDEELDAIIAHECGHIACRHVLYHSVANLLLGGSSSFLGSWTLPIQYAMFYWQRKSELSCDRAASIVTSPMTVASSMARFSGGPKSITSKINMEEWAKQADAYDAIYNDGLWNKALQISEIASLDHPFAAVRVREILKWGESVQYKNIMEGIRARTSGKTCPQCGAPVAETWKYCKACGCHLQQ